MTILPGDSNEVSQGLRNPCHGKTESTRSICKIDLQDGTRSAKYDRRCKL